MTSSGGRGAPQGASLDTPVIDLASAPELPADLIAELSELRLVEAFLDHSGEAFFTIRTSRST
jgi:hypothetical protein